MLSKLSKGKFFLLCDAMFLVRLQEKFKPDHWLWSERVKLVVDFSSFLELVERQQDGIFRKTCFEETKLPLWGRNGATLYS